MKIYRFRNCYLNLKERLVLKNGKFVELTPKTFDVLHLLVENCGEILTKDQILGKVWNGSFVEEGNLAVHISKLRRSLDETKTHPFIETVPGSGYRFIAPVKIVSQQEWDQNSPELPSPAHGKNQSEPALDSIAVLPLCNESKDPEIEYLADGLTEGFINSLSYLPNLKVLARNTVFRYKEKEIDPKEVGDTLGVSAVLTGRVRVIQDQLLISVELTKVDDGCQLWGTQLNQPFSDIVEVQEKIIFAVSENLKTQIATQNSANSITQNSESYRLYLKGKYFLDKRTEHDICKAIECLQKSLSYDPTNVYSQVEVIECYGQLYASDFISYESFITKSSSLLSTNTRFNDSIDVVQSMYGRNSYYEWKFENAERHLRHALSLNPNNLLSHYRYTDLLMASGRFSEALEQINRIMRIDPLSFRTYLIIGRAFYKMGRFENALIYLNDALELEPNSFEALAVMGATITELGNYHEALNVFKKSLMLQYNSEVLSMIGYVNALIGDRDNAYEIIKQLQSHFHKQIESPTILSRIYAALEEYEEAFMLLEQAFNKHEADLISLNSDPRWRKIKNKPQFKELVTRIGLK
jgi:TolB-like protein/tetratricopeptide (TPR) repeat protein